MHINPDLSSSLVAPSQLWAEYGGEMDASLLSLSDDILANGNQFEFGPEYLPALVDLCLQRREANFGRWKAAGGTIGLSEWDFLPHLADLAAKNGEDSGVEKTNGTDAAKLNEMS